MSHIAERLQAVRRAVESAAAKAQRASDGIDLLAVSKGFSSDCVAAAVNAGQFAFGENYVQEALPKIARFEHDPRMQWHLIGPLQSNKAGLAAAHFDWVQSVDRERIASRLSALRSDAKPPLSVCIQVNISGEATKSGVAPDGALALARSLAQLPRLRMRGLMGIADPNADETAVRAQFRLLRRLFDTLRDSGFAVDTLSMGMSADMDAAIAEGATMVRIGTAIFGERRRKVAA